MVARTCLVFCAAALLVQSAYSACVGGVGAPYGFGRGYGYNGLAAPLAYDGIAPGYAYEGFAGPGLYERAGLGCGCGGVASTGGGLPCASASPIPPVGVSVLSENAYEGVLAAGGNLPFLGTVGVEGVLPTVGAGAVSYGCGNSRCAIGVEEGAISTGIAPHEGPYGLYGAGPFGYNGINEIGYGYGSNAFGYGRAGCGCGAVY